MQGKYNSKVFYKENDIFFNYYTSISDNLLIGKDKKAEATPWQEEANKIIRHQQ